MDTDCFINYSSNIAGNINQHHGKVKEVSGMLKRHEMSSNFEVNRNHVRYRLDLDLAYNRTEPMPARSSL